MNTLRHVAVNARFLLPGGLEGMGRFTDEIVKRWVQSHPDVKFTLFFDRPFDPRFVYGPNVEPVVVWPPARHPFLFWIWFEWKIAAQLKKRKPDVFFSPDGYLSLRSGIPQVPVFHDLAFLRFPADVKRSEAWFYHRYFPQYAKKATQLMAVSEFTKQDVVKQFGVPAEKIHVVYNACADIFHPLTEEEKAAVRQHWTGGEPYLHFVGAIQPRKNLITLIDAFNRFKARTGSPAKLVLIGRKAWNFAEIIHTYRESVYKNDIIFTGYLSDADMNAVVSASSALCYVSVFEGFGIPLVEAMKAGTPVICSNVTSMPEVADDAACLVDPQNAAEIAASMERIFSEPDFASSLIHKGTLRSKAFSWDYSAQQAWEVLEKAVFSSR